MLFLGGGFFSAKAPRTVFFRGRRGKGGGVLEVKGKNVLFLNVEKNRWIWILVGLKNKGSGCLGAIQVDTVCIEAYSAINSTGCFPSPFMILFFSRPITFLMVRP